MPKWQKSDNYLSSMIRDTDTCKHLNNLFHLIAHIDTNSNLNNLLDLITAVQSAISVLYTDFHRNLTDCYDNLNNTSNRTTGTNDHLNNLM